MCEVSAAPEYVRACACTASEGVTRGYRVETPHKSPNSWIRGYKFQKTSHEPFQTGFLLMVLDPLLGTRAALIIFVRSIPGRQAYLDPSKIPPQDRD
eukprot:612626-Pelagomonas_calceolata.AAC.1